MNQRFPDQPGSNLLTPLLEAWEHDGLTVISRKWSPEQMQFTFRAQADLSPVLIASRAKGRLDHALRKAGSPVTFSRRVGFRSLGENLSDTVLAYLAKQYDRVELADPRYIDSLRSAFWENPGFDASDPIPTTHGRYWFDLHLVMVTEDRYRIGRSLQPVAVRDGVLEWGRTLKANHRKVASGHGDPGVNSIAVMHDHVHVVFRGNISMSPLEMASDLWTRLNRLAGCRMYQDRIYVGSFSEYTLHAVKRC